MITLTVRHKQSDARFEVKFSNEFQRDKWLKDHKLPINRRSKNYNRFLEVIAEWKEVY